MRLIFKAKECEEAKLVSSIFREEVRNITAFSVVELILGEEDEISVSDACAKISIDLRNDFIQEKDEKAIRFLVAQKISITNIKRLEIGEEFVEEIAANKMLAKAGYEDALVYYYYNLISKMDKKMGFEEFVFLNIPWLSLNAIDDHDTKLFLNIIPRFNYNRNYGQDTKELFDILKGELKGPAIMKAVKLYRGLRAGYKI